MKKTILFLILIIVQLSATAQYFNWAKRVGGSGNDIGFSIKLDGGRNIFTLGWFQKTVDFDPGSGIYNLTAPFDFDAFISKSDSSGNLLWAKQIGGTGRTNAYNMVLDDSGNIYATGTFTKIVDFDPGIDVDNYTAKGPTDMFIIKLDSSGNLVWIKTIGNAGSFTESYSISIDSKGNIFTTGTYNGSVDFNPNAGISNLISPGINESTFILKLDANGDFEWAKSIPSVNGNNSGNSISIDLSDNILISGSYSGKVDFITGTGTQSYTSAGDDDIFILKLNNNGGFIWVQTIGGKGEDKSKAIDIDEKGDIYLTGYFAGLVDFDPGTGKLELNSVGGADIFISKFTKNGNIIWAKATGGINTDQGNSIKHDGMGNIYITGSYMGNVDFDPGVGTNFLPYSTGYEIFISKFDTTGNLIWAKGMGGKNFDQGNSIAIDNSENVYVTGCFYETTDFNPGPGTYNLTSLGNNDIYTLKLGKCIVPIFTSEIKGPSSVCQSISANYSISPVKNAENYKWFIPSGWLINSGQNSSSVNITIGTTSGKIMLIVSNECGSDTSEKYIEVKKEFEANFSADDVCEQDSVNFINKSNGASYTWKFGDGEYSSLESPKHFYNISGISQTFNVTLVAKLTLTCFDSITKPVTVNANPKSDFTFNTSGRIVFFNAIQPGNTSYTWDFGDGGTSTMANPKYEYLKFPSGKYNSCLIVKNSAGCDSKTCKEVNITGSIHKQIKATDFKIYPNPNSGSFEIKVENPAGNSNLTIYNSIGDMVKTVPLNSNQKNYLLELNMPGIYFVKIESENQFHFERIIVNKDF